MSTSLQAPERLDLAAVVEDCAHVADEVVTVVLALRDGDVPSWEPGAHIDLELPDGLVRPYSLCGIRGDRALRIAVLREPGGRGGSRAVHELRPGAAVRIRAVRNNFPLRDAPSYVFVAGGIGITPLIPMIAEVDRRGASWALHYAGRSLGSMAFAEALAEEHPGRVRLYAGDRNQRMDVDEIIALSDPAGALYCCGPAGLVRQFEATCASTGRSGYLERFSASAVDGSGETSADDNEFEVRLERTGVTVRVAPGQSILEVAEAAGGDVFGSCEEGICGTCETRVLEGTPDHRDSVLCGQDTGTMMVCVSRSRGPRLVLDA